MLEQEIVALREAVEKLTAQLQAQMRGPEKHDTRDEKPEIEASKAEPTKVVADNAEGDAPITERDVQDLALRVSREKGAAAVKEILEPYGKRISLIDAKHYADIKAAFDKALG